MAMLPNRLLRTVIARVAATLCWNLWVPHIAAARAQEPHHFPFSSGDQPRSETWYNLAAVKYIDRTAAAR